MKKIRVAETFTNFQGEGPSTGKLSFFLRLFSCNFSCSWCDTKYANKSFHLVTPKDMAKQINASRAHRLVITGGEPLLQQKALVELCRAVNMPIEIETNGFFIPNVDLQELVTQWNISPKMPSSGNKMTPKYIESLKWWTSGVNNIEDNYKGENDLLYNEDIIFKFVIGSNKDFNEAMQFLTDNRITIRRRNMWLMPKGNTRKSQIENSELVAERAKGMGYNLSLRMHSIIWDGKRGV